MKVQNLIIDVSIQCTVYNIQFMLRELLLYCVLYRTINLDVLKLTIRFKIMVIS